MPLYFRLDYLARHDVLCVETLSHARWANATSFYSSKINPQYFAIGWVSAPDLVNSASLLSLATIFFAAFDKHAYNMPKPRSTVNFVPSSIGFLLNDISRTFRRHFDVKMAEYGLTQAQWRALLIIATRQGCTQRELADALEVQPISVARLLDRMVKGGWVKREPCPSDRRAHRLYLTSQCAAANSE